MIVSVDKVSIFLLTKLLTKLLKIMCLTLTKNSKIKQATKNIIVYKGLLPTYRYIISSYLGFEDKNVGRSPYHNTLYEKYDIQFANIGKIYTYGTTSVINEGLHSCTTKDRARIHSNYVVKMIIPKGAYYIKGRYNEIVSDILIW